MNASYKIGVKTPISKGFKFFWSKTQQKLSDFGQTHQKKFRSLSLGLMAYCPNLLPPFLVLLRKKISVRIRSPRG